MSNITVKEVDGKCLPQVELQLQLLEQVSFAFSEVSCDLEAKLTGILIPSSPNVPKELDEKSDQLVPVAQKLRQINISLQATKNKLCSIITRCEL